MAECMCSTGLARASWPETSVAQVWPKGSFGLSVPVASVPVAVGTDFSHLNPEVLGGRRRRALLSSSWFHSP